MQRVDGAAAWESGEENATEQHSEVLRDTGLEAVNFQSIPGARLATNLLQSLYEELMTPSED